MAGVPELWRTAKVRYKLPAFVQKSEDHFQITNGEPGTVEYRRFESRIEQEPTDLSSERVVSQPLFVPREFPSPVRIEMSAAAD